MIKLTLNLATRPWYDRRLFRLVLAVVVLLLALLAGSGGYLVFEASRDLHRLKSEIRDLDQQLTSQRAGLSQKQLALQRQQVVAINRILEQRAMQRWVQQLDDLEGLVPDEGIALTRMEPDLKGQGLILHGRSKGFGDLQRLLEKLAHSSRFKEPVLVSHITVLTPGQASLLQFIVAVKPVTP